MEALRTCAYDADPELLKSIQSSIDLEELLRTFNTQISRGSTYHYPTGDAPEPEASAFFGALYAHTLEKYGKYLEEYHVMTNSQVMEILYRLISAHQAPHTLMPQFKAIFVDEFQDTDYRQYRVIKNLFGAPESANLLVYIGDPKQNIYTWRDADLNTYFAARSAIQEGHHFTMKTNYRSTGRYLDALNRLYNHTNLPFDHDLGEANPIPYISLEASEANRDMRGLERLGEAVHPIQLLEQKDEEEQVVRCALHLLYNGFTINGAGVKPSDIGILAASNRELNNIKSLLEAEGIPAVLTRSTTIWREGEAKFVHTWLQAILQPIQAHIALALRTPFLGLTEEEALAVDRTRLLNGMDALRQLWKRDGIYPMMDRLISGLKLDQKPALQAPLARIQQIAECLAEKEAELDMGPEELLHYLSQAHFQGARDEEEDDQSAAKRRIETDEDAINLSTFHKAKGLEFPVVLMLKNPDNAKLNDFVPYIQRHGDGIAPRFCYLKDVEHDLHKQAKAELIKEDKRRVYVGLTRARYATVWVFKPNSRQPIHLAEMLALKEDTHFKADAVWTEPPPVPAPAAGDPTHHLPTFTASSPASRGGYNITYSLLALHGAAAVPKGAPVPEGADYDQFVFETLPKGQHIGHLLHQVFEFIDFGNPGDWTAKVEQAVLRYLPSRKGDAAFAAHLHQLVDHTLNASIRIGSTVIRLSDLHRKDRIQELSFDYPLSAPLEAYGFNHLFAEDDGRRVNARAGAYEGMMNGIMDMFFRWEGKYYILDWKSNYLGSRIEDYQGEVLREAMNGNNYHLQYLLYTLAADRYLSARLGSRYQYERDFGGIIYLFLRGVRRGASGGVYTAEVARSTLDTMKAWVGQGAPTPINPR